MEKHELSVIEPQNTEAQPATTLQMISNAISQGMDITHIEKFMDLHERNEKNEAKKAYHKAFAAFKADPPKIIKDTTVDYTSSKGRTLYNHASIGNVVSSIIEGLGKHGLSHSWTVRQDKEGVHITCTLTHSLGHSESTSMTAPPDASGGKNTIQAICSTTTYLERYTLLAITGMATSEMDDDGRASEQKAGHTTSELLSYIKWFVDNKKTADELDRWVEGKLDHLSPTDYAKVDKAVGEATEALVAIHSPPPKTYTCPQGGRKVTIDECNECEVFNDCAIHKEEK